MADLYDVTVDEKLKGERYTEKQSLILNSNYFSLFFNCIFNNVSINTSNEFVISLLKRY